MAKEPTVAHLVLAVHVSDIVKRPIMEIQPPINLKSHGVFRSAAKAVCTTIASH